MFPLILQRFLFANVCHYSVVTALEMSPVIDAYNNIKVVPLPAVKQRIFSHNMQNLFPRISVKAA